MSDALLGFELTDNDRSLLRRIQQDLPLLADIARADLVLYCRALSGDVAELIFEIGPSSAGSDAKVSALGKKVTAHDEPELFQVLRSGKPRRLARRETTWGSPSIREMVPIANGSKTIGVLSVEMASGEWTRQQKMDPVLRLALSQLQRMILAGQLDGAKNISPFGEHDVPLVVDSDGRILYISAVAESLYQRLGQGQALLHSKITDLGTDEIAYHRALETGVCAEQLVHEGPLVLVKKAIPITVLRRNNWWERSLRKLDEIDGAILFLHDATEEQRKEQEIRIKATMIQEIHHRVKNNLQTIAALLRLQARRTGSEEVVEMLRQTVNRILSVAVVHEFLAQDEASVIDVKEVCQRVLDEVTQAVLDPEKRIRFVLDGSKIFLPAQQATSCALIVNELLQNAVEHGFDNRWSGTIAVNLQDNGSTMTLEIADDGQGLPPGFSISKGANLGLQIVNTLVKEDLRGEFELVSGTAIGNGLAKGEGVRAIVTIPRSQRSQKSTLGVGR